MTIMALPNQPTASARRQERPSSRRPHRPFDRRVHRQDHRQRRHASKSWPTRRLPTATSLSSSARHPEDEHAARHHRPEGAAGAHRRRHVQEDHRQVRPAAGAASAQINQGTKPQQRRARRPDPARHLYGDDRIRPGGGSRATGRRPAHGPRRSRRSQSVIGAAGSPRSSSSLFVALALLVREEPQRRVARRSAMAVQAAGAARLCVTIELTFIAMVIGTVGGTSSP